MTLSERDEALSSADSFCRAHSLTMNSTYSFSKCGGEVGAHRLAQEWCRRMQHLFNAYTTSAPPVNWPAVIARYPIDEAFEQWVQDSGDRTLQQRAAQTSAIMPL